MRGILKQEEINGVICSTPNWSTPQKIYYGLMGLYAMASLTVAPQQPGYSNYIGKRNHSS